MQRGPDHHFTIDPMHWITGVRGGARPLPQNFSNCHFRAKKQVIFGQNHLIFGQAGGNIRTWDLSPRTKLVPYTYTLDTCLGTCSGRQFHLAFLICTSQVSFPALTICSKLCFHQVLDLHREDCWKLDTWQIRLILSPRSWKRNYYYYYDYHHYHCYHSHIIITFSNAINAMITHNNKM